MIWISIWFIRDTVSDSVYMALRVRKMYILEENALFAVFRISPRHILCQISVTLDGY